MRILHITQYCHAGTIGGTERYILDLIQGLEANGMQNAIGWLQRDTSARSLISEGVRIFILPTTPMRVDAPLAGLVPAAEKVLNDEQPDLLHFHTFGLTEAALARLAQARGIPYVFTYHSPAWTCRRETMLLYGKELCDGEVRAWRCSACQSEERIGRGVLAGQVAAAVSMAAGWPALAMGSSSLRRRTVFYYDSVRFRRGLRRFLSECDLVVSCADWSTPILRRNGAREECLWHCPQGVPNAAAEALRVASQIAAGPACHEFVIGFVGRVVEVKGPHILMEAFSRLKSDQARLRIVGWETDRAEVPYARRLSALARADARIELVPRRSFGETLAEYQRLSLLAIPSTWMETGPLTLLEALGLGVPVFGSNRIGQLKLLREHGQVVEPNTPAGWLAALSGALAEFKRGAWETRRERLRQNPQLFAMSDVAVIMAARYQALRNPAGSLALPA